MAASNLDGRQQAVGVVVFAARSATRCRWCGNVPFPTRSERAVEAGDFDVLLSYATRLLAIVGVVDVAGVPPVRDGRGPKFLRLAKPCLQGIFLVAELVDEIACVAPQRV